MNNDNPDASCGYEVGCLYRFEDKPENETFMVLRSTKTVFIGEYLVYTLRHDGKLSRFRSGFFKDGPFPAGIVKLT